MKARALRNGDVISLIAPASAPIAEERIENSVKYFERQGFRVQLGRHLTDRRGYLAANDKDRLRDLHSAFSSKQVSAVFFLRGGYGSIRLLPEIDYDLIRRNPKILVGYSDATALFLGLWKKTRLESMFFGPMPAVDIWNGFDPYSEEHLWRALTSATPLGLLPLEEEEGIVMRGRKKYPEVIARLFGGNLTVFSSMMGTPFMPTLKNAALFFEDIDEKPYRIDRYLAQLRASGVIESASAIMLGQFSGCEPDPGVPSLSTDEIFEDYFGKLEVPVVMNLPSGHIPRQWTLPFGASYAIKASNGKARIAVIESTLR